MPVWFVWLMVLPLEGGRTVCDKWGCPSPVRRQAGQSLLWGGSPLGPSPVLPCLMVGRSLELSALLLSLSFSPSFSPLCSYSGCPFKATLPWPRTCCGVGDPQSLPLLLSASNPLSTTWAYGLETRDWAASHKISSSLYDSVGSFLQLSSFFPLVRNERW